MYELHVWLCFEIARESVKLLIQLYGTTDTAVVECIQLLVQLFPLMIAAGRTSRRLQLGADSNTKKGS